MPESTVTTDEERNVEIQNDDRISDSDLPLSYTQNRHIEPIEGIDCITQTWRMKERMKTVSVALVLCLNVGVDPPDVVKTQPCARLECWVDPLTMSASKSLEKIGANLQAQYERWQPRARYKQSLDPTAEEVKKLCTSLRRNAKEERVLFHYNGHGVPKPTTNGEVWVFNRTYTQYIPLSIYDLQTWMGAPSIYVYDCSNAGIIIDSFRTFALQHESEYEQMPPQARSSTQPNYRNCIQLAACSANQVLPMNPDLPADLFTSCLTTPIKVALRWYLLQSTSKLVPKLTLDLIDKIPGQITDRRTMLGELNWIFTAITDTIAWNVLPRDIFQKLFRQDLLVASLFRNFLLAERILKSCDCTPISSPQLPSTYQHPMWSAWDLALDLSLGQLPDIIYSKKSFQHLPFFEEQLTAFQVWLDLGCEERSPPEQLPIVLQVLLSQVHRMRALELLGRFLDLGPWAVNLALSVGIFPYVLKLLQSVATELRPLLVFIWAKILAVDNTCQTDLVRDNGHRYFLSVLQDISLLPEHRTQAAFVLASIVHKFRDGQEATLSSSVISICLEHIIDPCPQLKQWIAICLGRLWDQFMKARWTAMRDTAHDKLLRLLRDPYPEVRAAAVYALGTYMNAIIERSSQTNNIDRAILVTLVRIARNDISCLVRQEVVNALQWVVLSFEHVYLNIALNKYTYPSDDDINASFNTNTKRLTSSLIRDNKHHYQNHHHRLSEDNNLDKMKRVSSSSSITSMMSQMISTSSLSGSLDVDPYPDIARMSRTVTGHIKSMIEEHMHLVDNKMMASMSLPPSPNRGHYLSGDSPPSVHSSPDMQKYARSVIVNRSGKIYPNSTINEKSDDEDQIQFPRTPLVTTNFVQWSTKMFAQSVRKDKKINDVESRLFYERDWRYTRNVNIRREALDEQKRVLTAKLDSQVFNIRTAIPPTLLQFHPFDQQIAVAGKDSFGVWDWGTSAKTTVCQNKSSKTSTGSAFKVTALEWINGHDIAMLLVASNDGSVKVWKPNTGQSREPTLISAWSAFHDFKSTYSGVLLAWEQWSQTLITAGDARHIRFWNVEKEMFEFEIPTGTDASVTCIDSTYNSVCHEKYSSRRKLLELQRTSMLIDYTKDIDKNDDEFFCGSRMGMVCIGCYDGTVRLFDRRCNPNESKVKQWREHNGPVLGVQCRGNLIISGSCNGDIRIYDMRKNAPLLATQALQSDMSCFAIHRSANIYACGSLNENVNLYTIDGQPLNTIKVYEGFMGHRTGPVTCLNFHPHRVALAMGTSDCSVSVYCLESRR